MYIDFKKTFTQYMLKTMNNISYKLLGDGDIYVEKISFSFAG